MIERFHAFAQLLEWFRVLHLYINRLGHKTAEVAQQYRETGMHIADILNPANQRWLHFICRPKCSNGNVCLSNYSRFVLVRACKFFVFLIYFFSNIKTWIYNKKMLPNTIIFQPVHNRSGM